MNGNGVNQDSDMDHINPNYDQVHLYQSNAIELLVQRC